MCGIWGTSDNERFDILYQLNRDRGNFAYGGYYVKDSTSDEMEKIEGVKPLSSPSSKQFKFKLGHTQSPTSSKRSFDFYTSHPFIYDSWYVAHNGVLTNDRVLAKELQITNPVDTAVIPALICREFDSSGSSSEVSAIERAFSLLKGTFGCWIYNSATLNAYIVRCGSTLFYKDCEFSSRCADGMTSLEEGIVYKVNYNTNTIESIGEFVYDSPYLIL